MTIAKQLLGIVEEFSRLGKPVINFEDGLEWVDVSSSDNMLLTLRVRDEKTKEGESWLPKIWVSIEDGVIRRIWGNVLKMHQKYLIPLFLKNFVTRIELGNDSSFSMNDLDTEVLKELRRVKPELENTDEEEHD